MADGGANHSVSATEIARVTPVLNPSELAELSAVFQKLQVLRKRFAQAPESVRATAEKRYEFLRQQKIGEKIAAFGLESRVADIQAILKVKGHRWQDLPADQFLEALVALESPADPLNPPNHRIVFVIHHNAAGEIDGYGEAKVSHTPNLKEATPYSFSEVEREGSRGTTAVQKLEIRKALLEGFRLPALYFVANELPRWQAEAEKLRAQPVTPGLADTAGAARTSSLPEDDFWAAYGAQALAKSAAPSPAAEPVAPAAHTVVASAAPAPVPVATVEGDGAEEVAAEEKQAEIIPALPPLSIEAADEAVRETDPPAVEVAPPDIVPPPPDHASEPKPEPEPEPEPEPDVVPDVVVPAVAARVADTGGTADVAAVTAEESGNAENTALVEQRPARSFVAAAGEVVLQGAAALVGLVASVLPDFGRRSSVAAANFVQTVEAPPSAHEVSSSPPPAPPRAAPPALAVSPPPAEAVAASVAQNEIQPAAAPDDARVAAAANLQTPVSPPASGTSGAVPASSSKPSAPPPMAEPDLSSLPVSAAPVAMADAGTPGPVIEEITFGLADIQDPPPRTEPRAERRAPPTLDLTATEVAGSREQDSGLSSRGLGPQPAPPASPPESQYAFVPEGDGISAAAAALLAQIDRDGGSSSVGPEWRGIAAVHGIDITHASLSDAVKELRAMRARNPRGTGPKQPAAASSSPPSARKVPKPSKFLRDGRVGPTAFFNNIRRALRSRNLADRQDVLAYVWALGVAIHPEDLGEVFAEEATGAHKGLAKDIYDKAKNRADFLYKKNRDKDFAERNREEQAFWDGLEQDVDMARLPNVPRMAEPGAQAGNTAKAEPPPRQDSSRQAPPPGARKTTDNASDFIWEQLRWLARKNGVTLRDGMSEQEAMDAIRAAEQKKAESQARQESPRVQAQDQPQDQATQAEPDARMHREGFTGPGGFTEGEWRAEAGKWLDLLKDPRFGFARNDEEAARMLKAIGHADNEHQADPANKRYKLGIKLAPDSQLVIDKSGIDLHGEAEQDDAAITASFEYFKKTWGSALVELQGSEAFQQRAARIAVGMGLKLRNKKLQAEAEASAGPARGADPNARRQPQAGTSAPPLH